METILITGAKGQLGSEIKKLSSIYNNFNYIFTDVDELDITNIDALDSFFAKKNISFIVNCAAYTAVDKAESELEKARKLNVEAVKNLKNIANKYKANLIQISTDYVFDSSLQNTPFKENDATCAKSVYGYTKLEGEKILYGLDNTLIIRTSWLYSSFANNFVKTMLRLGNERDNLGVVFDQVGTPTYAEDLADTILKIIEYSIKNKIFKYGIYHFSNEGVCSWYDFATEIMNIAKLNCRINPIESKDYPVPAKRPNYSVLNKTKIKNEFNIEIPHWRLSLRKCLDILL